ncbi:Putative peptidase S8/S53 domain, peptidase S53, activation domain-containing protein [Septoria linicola]|uniref:tripeptidyl-peptidase II n=1 Tax=Septoria linicola TaxID=215465 RepID=A0A9Q9EM85_9PEZI|nr:putative peptidase S8/S53 domain, peptidase S53, activation domain-containing protein [Septoria linicola]USW55262.1 Putative peptidase S8/S53 domain, peptidase S53, activation domain-containing protein [Septoria linicola]
MKSVSIAALYGLTVVLAAPLEDRSDYAVHNSHFVPPGWEKTGIPAPDHTVNLRIGLKQASFDKLEKELYEVSDPNHSRYGQHLSMSDIHSLTAPAEDAISAVEEWLRGHGISAESFHYSPPKDWITIALPVSKIESLLDTKYHQYRHEDGAEVVRTTQYSLPRSLHGHIDVIQPTNYFGNPKHHATGVKIADFDVPMSEIPGASSRVASVDAALPGSNLSLVCVNGQTVSSLCVRTLYNTVDYTPKVPQKNYAGITNYLNQTPSDIDFHLYMAAQRPGSDPKYQYSRQIIAGAADNQLDQGVEANLDVQAVGGISYPTRFTSYSTGGSPPFTPDLLTPTNTNEPYLTWLDYVLKQKDVPYVISTSYGDNEQTVPKNYATRVCAELAQLGARGVTLLFSSGDNGVGKDGTCVSNDGKNTNKFLPSFPASCPYITTVGGTRDFQPEQVAFDTGNGYVAGGGFSEYFPRPGYQALAVPQYLASIGDLNQGLYNRGGRAYPDIAAQGFRYQIFYKGVLTAVDGTSVSSPVAAGVLTNVNDALLAAGRPPLGFINPLLYASNGKGYNDVTVGNVTGCGTSGFSAKKGWDAASGWGTPDFKAIRKALGV